MFQTIQIFNKDWDFKKEGCQFWDCMEAISSVLEPCYYFNSMCVGTIVVTSRDFHPALVTYSLWRNQGRRLIRLADAVHSSLIAYRFPGRNSNSSGCTQVNPIIVACLACHSTLCYLFILTKTLMFRVWGPKPLSVLHGSSLWTDVSCILSHHLINCTTLDVTAIPQGEHLWVDIMQAIIILWIRWGIVNPWKLQLV